MNSHSDSPIAIRPLETGDADSARAIFAAAAGEPNPYAGRLRERLESALAATSAEHRALVAVGGGEVIGIAVYGDVAGALGAGVLYAAAVAPEWVRRGAGAALLRAVEDQLTLRGARVAIAELPDEVNVEPMRRLLLAGGFHEESRIADYYRDGVALVFMRHDLVPRRGRSRPPDLEAQPS
ncbi:MAG: GNAT family N-acetyltransferase [Gemmatimonadaceae bacterium]